MRLNMGDTLRQLRRARNLTQEEVAAQLGISFQAVSKWERNEGYPDITLLSVLARFFGVTADALLLVQMSTSLEKLGGAENLRESIAAQEQILRHCTDNEVHNAVQYNICHSYWCLGERKHAAALARQLPNLYKTRENALVYFSDGEEKRCIAAEALTPLAWSLGTHLHALWETTGDAAYLRKAQTILALLFEDALPPPLRAVQEKITAALAP